MSTSKRLVVNLRETPNNEIERSLKEDYKKNSQFIRDAIILYIEKRQKLQCIENMKMGYKEMAQMNVEISETNCTEDFDCFEEYEVWLTECDLPDEYCSEKRRYILC